MRSPQSISLVCLTSAVLLLGACATIRDEQKPSDYPKEIARLEAKLRESPDNPGILRDLGVLYFQDRQFPKAKEHLRKAVALEKDARALCYYGMTLEADSEAQAALAVYINYTDFSALSPYRKLMEGRYRTLTQTIIRQQMRDRAQEESRLGDPTSPTTVAVFPLAYQSTDEKYASLGKGLGEMMITDLGQVNSLTLVERIRVEALLDELRFGATNKVDPATAPRLGKFLSAGRIVSGTYNVSTDNRLRMDVGSYDVITKRYPEPASESDALENLFRVEKDLVFGVVKDMGITLSKEESERIERIPTKNLQAFMLYCRGLDDDDKGDFKSAEVMYSEASRLDPGFEAAKKKADAASALSFSGGILANAFAAVEAVDRPLPVLPPLRQDLILDRLQHLSGGIGGSFYQGPENRKAPEEALSARGLGRPPQPPKQ